MRIDAAGVACVLFASAAFAQSTCGHAFLPGLAIPGTSSQVLCSTAWDPDGAGPQPGQWIVGGAFASVGGVPARGIASFDPVTRMWSPLGAGLTGSPVVVQSLLALPTGELLVGGSFLLAGGPANGGVVRWDGSQWTSLGTDLFGNVTGLAQLPNGDIAAAGQLYVGASFQRSPIAIWNGGMWSIPGSGLTPDYVNAAMTQLPNGDLLLTGQFTAPYAGRAVWNGAAWSPAPTLGNGDVDRVLTAPNGDLVVTGTFTSVGGIAANGIVRWNGQGWANFGSIAFGAQAIAAMVFLPNGDLVVGGEFTQLAGVAAASVARWDGTAWLPLGAGLGDPLGYAAPYPPLAMTLAALPNGDLFVGGRFSQAGDVVTAHVATWDGTEWSAPTGGSNGSVLSLRTLRSGDVLAGGEFTVLGSGPARGIARWDGQDWRPLGTGMRGASHGATSAVAATVELANGDILAVGDFATASFVPCANVARWNGTTWSPLGSGLGGGTGFGPSALCAIEMPNGDLVVGGYFATAGGQAAGGIARWNGSGWSSLASGLGGGPYPITYPYIAALAVLPNGDLVAAGSFTSIDGVVASNVARWNGSSWSPLGSGAGVADPGSVTDLAILPNGDVLAVGWFHAPGGGWAGGASRWDGVAWSAFGPPLPFGSPARIGTAPNGDLLLAGTFPNSTDLDALVRYDGTAWSVVSSRFGPFSTPFANVVALAVRPDGEVFLGGTFRFVMQTSGSVQVSPYCVRLVSTCPATAVPTGSGCVGSGGANVLQATSLPWLGATCTSRASGMPAQGLAIGVLGLGAAAVPLATILPQGVTGCSLLATPDLLDLYVPNGGAVTTSLTVPNAPSLIGRTLQQQVVAVDLSAAGAITALTSTNALLLTIGVF